MKINPGILLAIALGLVMTAGSFFLAKTKDATANLTQGNQFTDTKQSVRTFISTKDSDQNNIPDWQEAFVGAEINLSEEVTQNPTLVSNLTAELATRAVAGVNDPEAIIEELDKKMTEEITEEQYEQDDIIIKEDNSPLSLRTYGNAVAVVAISGTMPAGTDTPLNILDRYFLRKDPTVLEELTPHIKAYQKMRDAMLVVSVPSSMTTEHLSLLNVYNSLSFDIADMQKAETDALAAMLRMRRYPTDAGALYTTISNLYLKLHQDGIQWNDNDAASSFIKIE